MSGLNSIRNFLQLNERLATSGMPHPNDFGAIRQAGYDAVINLAMPTSDDAMPNEGDLVTRAGMTYIHVPVDFEAPQPIDFERFANIMDTLKKERVYVHCAANMRVSAFVFLHRVLRGTKSRAEAERDLKRIWDPDGVWRQFINDHLAAAAQPPLE
jgi:protein tyrosine phosphatase (PTP) superfamily phosphohydrolase (DUF442 family)